MRRVATLVDWAFAPDWLTVEEASFLTGLSPQQVHEWVDAGYVDAEEVRGRWLIEKRSLAEFRETLIEVLADDD